MGCDIHLSTIYRNRKSNTYHPVTMTTRRIVNGAPKYFGASYPYFRNYEVFGTLTDGQVRSLPYYNEKTGRRYSLPCRGMFNIGIVSDITQNIVDDLWSKLYDDGIDMVYGGTSTSFEHATLDQSLVDYFVDPKTTSMHSHTYFSVAELSTLISKMKRYYNKLSKRINKDCDASCGDDQYGDIMYINELRTTIDLLKQIKQYGMMFGRIGSGDEWIEPEDVTILCCFDS